MSIVSISGPISEALQKRLDWVAGKVPEFPNTGIIAHIVNQSPDGSTYEQDALAFTFANGGVLVADAKQVEGFPHILLVQANSFAGFPDRAISYYVADSTTPVAEANLFGVKTDYSWAYSGKQTYSVSSFYDVKKLPLGTERIGPDGKTYVTKAISGPFGGGGAPMWVEK